MTVRLLLVLSITLLSGCYFRRSPDLLTATGEIGIHVWGVDHSGIDAARSINPDGEDAERLALHSALHMHYVPLFDFTETSFEYAADLGCVDGLPLYIGGILSIPLDILALPFRGYEHYAVDENDARRSLELMRQARAKGFELHDFREGMGGRRIFSDVVEEGHR